MIVRLIFMCVDTNLIGITTVRNCSIDTDLSLLLVVNGADLESILVSTDETRLLTSITGSSSAHDGGLGEDTGSTVGVGSILRVNGGEGDTVLVVLTQVEMSRKPGLNRPVLSNQVNELLALFLIRMVQPTASIHNVILLQHTQSRPIRRSMREHKDLPSILRLVRLNKVLKPVNLCLVNGNLMRSEFRITEQSGAHTHKKCLIGNLTAELRSFLVVCTEVYLKVLLVGFKLVKPLKIVVTPDNVVGDTHGAEEFRSHFMAHGGTGEEFTIGFGVVVAVFGLAQISKRDYCDISM
mmetsp:Transcript_3850/g.5615  ORF Transcript_3850/g.5615 Transcript_3850/m.5615 type:complete len:295 (+) Transcript_3850:400-1284(+)